MILLVASSTLSLLAVRDPVTSDSTGGAGPLSTIDNILFVLAAGILVLSIGRLLTHSRRDPLISAPERPNTVREDAVLLAVAGYFLAAMIATGMVTLTGSSENVVLGGLVIGNSAHLAGIGVCVYVAATRFDGGAVGFCCGRGSGESLRFGALSVGLSIVAIAMCPLIREATVSGILLFVPGFEFQVHPTVVALHDPSQPNVMKVAFWAGAVLVAPVAEEFFFRGLLQTFLGTAFRSRWAAIIFASILFGLVHLGQPSAIPALTVLAILMGFAYEKTGSLIYPVAIHAAFNLKTLVWDAIG